MASDTSSKISMDQILSASLSVNQRPTDSDSGAHHACPPGVRVGERGREEIHGIKNEIKVLHITYIPRTNLNNRITVK